MVRNSASFLSSDSRDCYSLVHCRRPRLEKRLIDGVLPMQPSFQANIMQCTVNQPRFQVSIHVPLNQCIQYVAHIFQIWLTPVGYEKFARRLKASQIVIFASAAAIDCLKSRDK